MTIRQDEASPSFRAPMGIFADYLRRSISIFYLLNQVWTGRLFIVAATLVGLLYGVYTVHRNGPSFTATVRISPAETDNSFGGVGGGGGLLAGLAGSTGAVALPKFTQFMLAIPSAGVAQDLDRKYDMLCVLFRGDCDPATHQWRERTGIREWFSGILARLGGLPNPNGARTLDDLAAYVGGSVSVEPNKINSMVELRYTNRKPEFAAKFLSAVVKSTNDHIREQSRDTQKRYVEYLSNSAGKTANVEQRMAIDALLLQEERQLMMTEVDVPYAAKVLDGPIVKPVNDAKKTIVTNAFIGFVLGAILMLSRDLLPRKWRFW
jgi:hypothetical protein